MPIAAHRAEIVSLLKKNLFALIIGETGSGKSTQLAQFILGDMKPHDFGPINSDEKE